MSQLEKKVREVQLQLEKTAEVLLTLRSKSNLTKYQKTKLKEAAQDIDKCRLILPTMTDKDKPFELVLKVIARTYDFIKTCFGS
jgi:hypothetical protein